MQDAVDVIDESMTRAGITNYTVDFNPASKAEVDTSLEPVTVTITVDFGDVTILTPDYFAGSNIVGRSTMPADLEEDPTGSGGGYDPLDDDHLGDGNVRFDDDPDDDDD